MKDDAADEARAPYRFEDARKRAYERFEDARKCACERFDVARKRTNGGAIPRGNRAAPGMTVLPTRPSRGG
jgi:hypothetical protein